MSVIIIPRLYPTPMDSPHLPYINPIISKKLKPKRLLQEATYQSLRESLIRFPNQYSNILQQISRAKNKIQRIINPSRAKQVVTIQDSVSSNKSFDKQLKLYLHRNKNYQLINKGKGSRKEGIPRVDSKEKDMTECYSKLNQVYRKGHSVVVSTQSVVVSKPKTQTLNQRVSKIDLPKLSQSQVVNGFPHYHVRRTETIM